MSASCIFDADGSMIMGPENFTGVSAVKKSWKEFTEFYQAFIKDIDYYYGYSDGLSFEAEETELAPDIVILRE